MGKKTWIETTLKATRRREDNIKVNVKLEGIGVERIYLTDERDSWRTVINTVMNPRISQMRGFD